MSVIIKYIIIILIAIALSGCVIPEPPEPEPRTDYRMFAVGVGDYLHYITQDINTAPLNAERILNLARSCRFGEEETEFLAVSKLIDLDATKENILNGITEAFAGADEDDVSYFYILAHGGLHESPEGDWVPIIAPSDSFFHVFETLITVHELEECLSTVPGTKVLWIESCHSGNLIDKSDITDFNSEVISIFENKKDLFNKGGYQVLVSSRGDEYSWASFDWSYFCRAILRGCENLLADTNDDEVVDMTELYTFIDDTVDKQHVQIYPKYSVFPMVEY